jgi:peptidoglycan-associated lipoprotein
MSHPRKQGLLLPLLALGLGGCSLLNPPPEEVGRLVDLAPARYGQYEYDPTLLTPPGMDQNVSFTNPVPDVFRQAPAAPAPAPAADNAVADSAPAAAAAVSQVDEALASAAIPAATPVAAVSTALAAAPVKGKKHRGRHAATDTAPAVAATTTTTTEAPAGDAPLATVDIAPTAVPVATAPLAEPVKAGKKRHGHGAAAVAVAAVAAPVVADSATAVDAAPASAETSSTATPTASPDAAAEAAPVAAVAVAAKPGKKHHKHGAAATAPAIAEATPAAAEPAPVTVASAEPTAEQAATADTAPASTDTAPPEQAAQPTGVPESRLVHFDVASDLIQDSDVGLLAQHAEYLQAHPEQHVRIEGHSDARGTDAYNVALAARRAGAVREYLIQQGVNSKQIAIVSYGKSKPLDPGAGEDAWEKNRRVELDYR